MSSNVSHITRVGAGLRAQPSLGPLAWLQSAWDNRVLIGRLARREIEARYRGSFLGVVWSVVVPILLLAVYTFVFSVVFQARWESAVQNKAHFALVLFSGLILFNVFSECINRAPTLMLSNITYIKKVVFPLEIIPVVTLIAALFNAGISFVVLAIGYSFLIGPPPLTVFLLPVLLVPLLLLTLGLSLFLSSVGVFIRDLQHVVSVLTMMLMFLTPIFFPLTAIPENFRAFIGWSPLALIVEDTRGALFWGTTPNPAVWTLLFVASWMIVWLGFAWFVKTKKGFADVI